MADEFTNKDIMDALNMLLERTSNMGKDITDIKEHAIKTDMKLEHDIEPKLQLLLENQGSISDNTKKIAAVEQRQDDLEDKVDGLGYAVKEIQKKMA